LSLFKLLFIYYLINFKLFTFNKVKLLNKLKLLYKY